MPSVTILLVHTFVLVKMALLEMGKLALMWMNVMKGSVPRILLAKILRDLISVRVNLDSPQMELIVTTETNATRRLTTVRPMLCVLTLSDLTNARAKNITGEEIVFLTQC